MNSSTDFLSALALEGAHHFFSSRGWRVSCHLRKTKMKGGQEAMLSSFNSSSPPAYWSRLIERGWKSTRFRNYYTTGPFETQLYKYSVSSRWLLVHNDQRDESFFSKFYHRCCWVGERKVWRTAEFCIPFCMYQWNIDYYDLDYCFYDDFP